MTTITANLLRQLQAYEGRSEEELRRDAQVLFGLIVLPPLRRSMLGSDDCPAIDHETAEAVDSRFRGGCAGRAHRQRRLPSMRGLSFPHEPGRSVIRAGRACARGRPVAGHAALSVRLAGTGSHGSHDGCRRVVRPDRAGPTCRAGRCNRSRCPGMGLPFAEGGEPDGIALGQPRLSRRRSPAGGRDRQRKAPAAELARSGDRHAGSTATRRISCSARTPRARPACVLRPALGPLSQGPVLRPRTIACHRRGYHRIGAGMLRS